MNTILDMLLEIIYLAAVTVEFDGAGEAAVIKFGRDIVQSGIQSRAMVYFEGVARWCCLVVLSVGMIFGAGQAAIAQKEYPPPLSFSNAELSNRDFSGQWLRGSELSNANLTGANFSDAHIEGAAMSGSTLTDTDLS
ncbi:MAG: pentapeptide repeat-containing protein, partial [Cyanobacteria bacterium P01_D01_bin.73]